MKFYELPMGNIENKEIIEKQKRTQILSVCVFLVYIY